MIIKHPVNFALGILCAMCFVVNIVKDRDAFALCVSAIGAAVNFTSGLIE